MNRNNKAVERLKTALIVLLIVSGVFFAVQSRLFGNAPVTPADVEEFFRALTGTAPEEDGTERQTTGAARPVSIAVTNESGDRYGVRYDLDALGAVYDRAVLIFGEALGSAELPRPVGAAEWRAALKSLGVYFEYMSPVDLTVLGGWYGNAEPPPGYSRLSARRLYVARGDGGNRLYFQDSGTGLFYAADTGSQGGIAELSEAFGINSVFFAFEQSGPQALPDPYALLMADVTAHPAVAAHNPLEDGQARSAALLDLGVNDHLIQNYLEPDGTRVFVESDFRLALSPDGTVGYRRTDVYDGRDERQDAGAAIELARQAVAGSIGKYCGRAAVYFHALEALEGEGYTVSFKYVVAGGVVHLHNDGYAALVTVRGGAVREMTLRFRSYAETDEMVEVLPEVQAAAAAAGPFALSYPDNGGDRLEPVWVEVG